MLPMLGKVEQAQDVAGGGPPLHRKDRVMAGGQDFRRMRGMQARRCAAARQDMLHAKEGAAGGRFAAVAGRGGGPVHLWGMDPTAVMRLGGVVAVAVVVPHG